MQPVTDQLEVGVTPDGSTGPERTAPAISTRTARGRLAVLVAVPVVAILVLTVGIGLGRRAGSESPPLSSGLPAGATLDEPGHVYFADADHGVALLRHCGADTCQAWLARTEDGGVTWTGDPVEGLSGPRRPPFEMRVRLRALDANRIALDSYDRDRRWFTADAGRTWTELSQDPKVTIDELPADGIATVAAGPLPQVVGVRVLRGDGTTAQLAHAPDVQMAGLNQDVIVAADGSAWLQGSDGQRPYAFLSRDRGRSWTSVPMPADAGPGVGNAGLSTSDGKHAYLVDSWRFLAWRTTDDGRTWQSLRVSIAKPTEEVGLRGFADAEGGLLLYDLMTRASYRFGPDHLTAGAAETLPGSHGTNGRRLMWVDRAGGPYEHSSDGRNWRRLPFASTGE
jgi:photosystem II stability/assembly factor-like uncharacterized protein